MAFRTRGSRKSCPVDPEALLRDLRKKAIPGLLSHQADLIRSYLTLPEQVPDVALQLPTGSGKTLVGLLIGEWRRRKYNERVVYLCPTNQLVNQVAEHAIKKYGMDVHAFTGKKAGYDPDAMADWQNAESIAITNYSSLFNINPFFYDPQLIICDDAHSAENYIASYWSLSIERYKDEHAATYSALTGILLPLLPAAERTRISATSAEDEDATWVEKIPTPLPQTIVPELISLLDEYTQGTDLSYSWKVIREFLSACHVYLSRRSVLIRPLIPPSNTHLPFAGAKQRIYMSATLGAGGDLERVTGRGPITRVPIPAGWDKQGIGRRLFLFPRRSLDEEDAHAFFIDATKIAGRALYLTPDDPTAASVAAGVTKELGFTVFTAKQIEESKRTFVATEQAVAVVANRYDGIDLIDDDCRLLFMDGLPRGANLQERFLTMRAGAQLLLDDRVLTRVVQGFGRCTRSPNDYAAVVILGESLHKYLLTRERRQFFHPEIQAEIEFGLEQSKKATKDHFIEFLNHLLDRDSDWDDADAEILSLRSEMVQNPLSAAEELASSVQAELSYQYAMWSGDYVKALDHCRTVLGRIKQPELRGYRALWLYLAGSAAFLATERGELDGSEVVQRYYEDAQKAAPSLRWLISLRRSMPLASDAPVAHDDKAYALVERLEGVIEKLGTTHSRKYDAEEAEILRMILQNDDGKLFEQGHERLGRLLGFSTGNSDADAAPDPWWIVDDELCFVFEDHAGSDARSVLGASKARQAASHPNWIREELRLPESTKIIPVLLTPATTATKGAFPHLRSVRCWNREEFREWAKSGLQVIRDIRRGYTGPANVVWRTDAANRLRSAKIAPERLDRMLQQSAYDALEEVTRQPESESD